MAFPPGSLTSSAYDLEMIEQRCRLKAEAARWAGERRRRLEAGEDYRLDIEPEDRKLIERAKALPDCFLWMSHPRGPDPDDPSMWDNVAGYFEAVSNGLAACLSLRELKEDHGEFEEGLNLLAEMQFALRGAIMEIDGRPDFDQRRVYDWLRKTAADEHIYIPRFMRSVESADPDDWEGLCDRVEALAEKIDEAKRAAKVLEKRLSKLQFVAGRIAESAAPEAEFGEWSTLLKTVEELLGEGVRPGNSDIRATLLPLLEYWPEQDSGSPEVQRVLMEIDRYLASHPDDDPTPLDVEPNEATQSVRALLQDRCVVLVGGEVRTHVQQALESAFGLEEILWIGEEVEDWEAELETLVQREDVIVVWLAEMWTNRTLEKADAVCKKFEKPVVTLPNSYDANLIAEQIISQAHDRLAAADSSE